jgi:hypothetical protein
VKPDAEIEAVYGEIIHQVAQYIAPDIRFYSLKELLRKNFGRKIYLMARH